MKAVIKLDVPEWQIGQETTVYFPDTMMKHGICQKDEIVRCKDCKYHGNINEDYCQCLEQETNNDFFCWYGEAIKDGIVYRHQCDCCGYEWWNAKLFDGECPNCEFKNN